MIVCSFCGESANNAQKMIQGKDKITYICNDCVEICVEILEEELPEFITNRRKREAEEKAKRIIVNASGNQICSQQKSISSQINNERKNPFPESLQNKVSSAIKYALNYTKNSNNKCEKDIINCLFDIIPDLSRDLFYLIEVFLKANGLNDFMNSNNRQSEEDHGNIIMTVAKRLCNDYYLSKDSSCFICNVFSMALWNLKVDENMIDF